MSKRTCSVEGCDRSAVARGWCMPCYKRWWKLPEPRPESPPPPRAKRTDIRCKTCDTQITARSESGLCRQCWLQRANVEVEEVEAYGIVFRRYPNAKSATHRYYFKPNGTHAAKGVEALHREVYKREIGPIPDGHEVHHIDHDPANNHPSNLKCVLRKEHIRIHSSGPRSEKQIKHWEKVQEAAKQWHRSPEGRVWHREHAKRTLHKDKYAT